MATAQSKKALASTARSKVRRHAGRGRYDTASIYAILDEGLYGHVGLESDGQPFVIPALYGRVGDELYIHGSPLSRLLGTAASGAKLCFAVTLLDGLVLARTAFHHSMNYRSVVIFGEARRVADTDEKLAALRAVVEHVVPGRSDDVRGPNEQELAATEVVALGLSEASAKIRSGPPIDGPEDMHLPAWAGELPLALATGTPITDKRSSAPIPSYVRFYHRAGNHGPDAA
jgi:nitroimidazol reductase NimA-like FMN-containing flavoprotein (pyridoxamine 5'-phosphate oxidase superfamily)